MITHWSMARSQSSILHRATLFSLNKERNKDTRWNLKDCAFSTGQITSKVKAKKHSLENAWNVHCLWNVVSIVKAVKCKDVQFRLQSLTVQFKFWPRFFNSIPIPIEMFLPLISIPIPILWTLKHPKSNSWIAHHWSSDAEADRPKMLHKSHNWAKNNTKPYRIYNDKGRLYWVRSSLHLKWVYTTYIKLHYTRTTSLS